MYYVGCPPLGLGLLAFGSPGQGSVSLWWFPRRGCLRDALLLRTGRLDRLWLPRRGCQVHNAVRRGTQKIYAQDHVVYDGPQHQEGYASTTVAELHCRDEGFVHCGATPICHADLGSSISSKLLVAPVSMVACLAWPSILTCATMRAFSTRMIGSIPGTGWRLPSPGPGAGKAAVRFPKPSRNTPLS
ncbi:hypothetical protein ACLKA6_017634 [Drosophila palustris]